MFIPVSILYSHVNVLYLNTSDINVKAAFLAICHLNTGLNLVNIPNVNVYANDKHTNNYFPTCTSIVSGKFDLINDIIVIVAPNSNIIM